MGRHTREQASELRGVAPLVVTGRAKLELVGPCTLVTNGTKTIGFSSAELLRAAPEPLAIALTLDGKRTLPVSQWLMSRTFGLGLIEFAEPFPHGEVLDVAPLEIAAICATIDTRGAPAALVSVVADGERFARQVVAVYTDALDGGGMADKATHVASPLDATDADASIDGAALIAWMPPDPVLGRASEVVAVALGLAYRSKLYKPREHAPIAELVELGDLGRVLPPEPGKPEAGNELGVVSGEIKGET